MNTYAKYCPNVFVAKCEKKYEKDEINEISKSLETAKKLWG